MDRWVASSALYRFQLPAANGSREACEPRSDPASLITKCGLKKDLSRTPQGTLPYVVLELFLAVEQGLHEEVVHLFQLLVGVQGGKDVLTVLVEDF